MIIALLAVLLSPAAAQTPVSVSTPAYSGPALKLAAARAVTSLPSVHFGLTSNYPQGYP